MKAKTLFATMLAAGIVGFASIDVSAQDKPAPKPGAGMQMDQKPRQQMMERMKQMQAETQRIHETRDPAERAKLMQDHMKHMQEGMQMMRGMGGESMGMMGGGMMGGGGHMMQGGKRGAGGQTMPMIEQRMDMMQMMMEQMMQHQGMMSGQGMMPQRPAK